MASFKTIEEEQRHQEQEYLKNFNGDIYYRDYCKEPSTYMEFSLISLHTAFSLDVKTGDSILDLGCGPNIYTSIFTSKWYKNIVVSDFVESNRESVRKWLRNDPSANDFQYMFKTAAALEHESDYRKLEARVRSSVKEVISCNVHLRNPIEPDQRKFDVIVSTYALESANLTLESYRRSISNVANLLNPGGKFFLVNALKTSYYDVAGHKFEFAVLTKHDINQALIDAGLKPCRWLSRPFVHEPGCTDCTSLVFVQSTKPL